MRSLDTAGDAQRRQRERFRFLEALYQRTGDDMSQRVQLEWVAGDINMDPETAAKIAQFLYLEELIALEQGGAGIYITNHGIFEVEQAVTRPKQETQHFPANVINVQTMTGSIIQQGTEGSSATITLGSSELAQIRNLLAEINNSIVSFDLSGDQAAELRADVASIDAQLQSPKPKCSVIREALSSIRAIMEGITANVVTSSMLPKIIHILAQLSH
jgi:hypothetical protein